MVGGDCPFLLELEQALPVGDTQRTTIFFDGPSPGFHETAATTPGGSLTRADTEEGGARPEEGVRQPRDSSQRYALILGTHGLGRHTHGEEWDKLWAQ